MKFEQLKYTNHKGETLNFGTAGLYVNANGLRNYSWEVLEQNSNIVGFKKGIQEKELPVVVAGAGSIERAIEIKNSLVEIMDIDVMEMDPGKFEIGDYYMNGYITAAEHGEYNLYKDILFTTLTITTDSPYWIKRDLKHFVYEEEEVEGGLDYPYDSGYDLTKSVPSMNSLVNENYSDADFELTIFGPVNDPKITIGENIYQLFYPVAVNEYVIINSKTKKITHVSNIGEKTNVFNYRDRENYIFEKIPVGTNTVVWDGEFGFDIEMLYERSAPKWI